MTRVRFDGKYATSFVANLLLSTTVKEFFFNWPTFFTVINEYRAARFYDPRCMYLVPFLRYSASNNSMTLKSELAVVQSRWTWRCSTDHIRLRYWPAIVKYHFYRAMLCIARTMPSQDVCQSVCLSHVGILSKRLYMSSNFSHRRVATPS